MKKGLFLFAVLVLSALSHEAGAQAMRLNDLEYFEARGTNVLVYNNIYNGGFYDEKFAGLEIIQRGERLATGGGIRLMNTPEQWDIFGTMTARKVNPADSSVEVELTYTDYDFVSRIRVTPKDKGCLVQVFVDKPVPEQLVGKAGMNLEFFPASYFGHNYLVDESARILPKYPMHDTEVHPVSEKIPQYFNESTFDDRGRGDFLVPLAMSTGHRIVMAPEDEALRVGPLEDLLADETVTEIMVNGPHQVYVERGGRLQLTDLFHQLLISEVHVVDRLAVLVELNISGINICGDIVILCIHSSCTSKHQYAGKNHFHHLSHLFHL